MKLTFTAYQPPRAPAVAWRIAHGTDDDMEDREDRETKAAIDAAIKEAARNLRSRRLARDLLSAALQKRRRASAPSHQALLSGNFASVRRARWRRFVLWLREKLRWRRDD